MAQDQRMAPFDLNAMASALPQPPYREHPYGQGAPRYSSAPVHPGATGQMAAPPFVGPGPMGSMHPPSYYPPHHPPVSHFYHPPLSPHPTAPNLPPRSDVNYYPNPVAVNQQPHAGPQFYYPPATPFQGQPQHVPGHMAPGQYGPPPPARPINPRPRQQQPILHQEAGPGAAIRQGNTPPPRSRQTVVRGPPRKPRQSGHAIWIGNLPPQTDLMRLVHHVCKETEGLESLFLISKSNCAFANYKDEQSCHTAQRKLHDSKFMAVRLVCRLRKNTVEGPAGVTAPTGPASSAAQAGGPVQESSSASGDPGPRAGGGSVSTPAAAAHEIRAAAPQQNGGTIHKDRFFILKSLTVEDLELSVRTNTWATQSHNEETLNSAFKTSDNVYLIFSANKSGEYFGYARMVSPMNDDPAAAVEFAPSAQSASEVDLPKAIPTDPTEFAPRGRIIDDSARGTIFWEADRDDKGSDGAPDDEGSGGSMAGETASVRSGQNGSSEADPKVWGKPFRLEWLSTTRLPFYRTRGLRNPWNSNREVKIARDGTELEPSVGRRLIGLFNRARSPAVSVPPSMVGPPAPVGGMRAPAPFMPGYPPLR